MTSPVQVLELAIVGWAPGAAVFRLPWWDRERRAALAAEERLFWAVVLSVSISIAAVLGLAALERYNFQRLLLVDLGLTALCVVLSRFRMRLGGAAPWPGRSALLPAALILLCVWRFFPTSEYIGGGKDPGTYMNEGIQIAQRGSLVVTDPVVASVPPFARNLFFPSHEREEYYGLRFMGFFVESPDKGTVVGQFFHGFPASIAIGYGLHGLTGARWTVAVWTLLGVLAVYFAGARLLGARAAAIAALLLAVHVITTWFAKYPNAEVMIQALVFAALLALARAHIDGDRFFSPIGGFLLGLLLFVRYDALLVIAAIAAGTILALFYRRRPHWSGAAVLLAAAFLAFRYYASVARPYVALPLLFLTKLTWWHIASLVAAGAAGIAAVFVAVRRAAASAWIVVLAPRLLATIAVAFAVYALVLRHPAGKLAAHDAYALRTFTSLYFTLPALLAALIGLMIIARRLFWRDPSLIAVVMVFCFFTFYKIRIYPEHFWMARRFLPVVLPGMLLLVAAAAFGRDQGQWRGAKVLRPLIALAFVALLAVHYSRVSAPLLGYVEHEGLIPRVEDLAKTIADDDLVIVESRDSGSDVHVLATPLAYIYARNVLLLNSAKPDKPTLGAFVDWAKTKYARVLFLGGGGTDVLSYRYGLASLASDRIRVLEYEVTVDRLPRSARAKDFEYGLYRFTTPSGHQGASFDLDVGFGDDLHVVRFHAKEKTDDATFRWSGRQSFVIVTVLPSVPQEVTLWMNSGGRPAAAPPAEVEVSFHNQLLGRARVIDGFRAYTFPIPAELGARAVAFGDPVELKIVTRTWNPLKTLGTPDDRELGVMVDRVQVR